MLGSARLAPITWDMVKTAADSINRANEIFAIFLLPFKKVKRARPSKIIEETMEVRLCIIKCTFII
ncbi:hypothetical protein A3D45_01530 [Candidatus Falkowbacteria bacterium RIFCSPHIGHO2_02_FULL_42_9]|uniref:Uncharacterized protein n=1 Tax=Candidatus Falkowbacteria bacterium RIFCSPHIGHO2_02_FULL_42_9 TaxID=1797986 RepID=A0A1F5S9X3_9BACT|nr:MAG: hypothetical protein A3D45_01530 [Candidatus Falkowbacteria bacterium RIFCSPHIGHO2_02_FULL_42_9]